MLNRYIVKLNAKAHLNGWAFFYGLTQDRGRDCKSLAGGFESLLVHNRKVKQSHGEATGFESQMSLNRPGVGSSSFFKLESEPIRDWTPLLRDVRVTPLVSTTTLSAN